MLTFLFVLQAVAPMWPPTPAVRPLWGRWDLVPQYETRTGARVGPADSVILYQQPRFIGNRAVVRDARYSGLDSIYNHPNTYAPGDTIVVRFHVPAVATGPEYFPVDSILLWLQDDASPPDTVSSKWTTVTTGYTDTLFVLRPSPGDSIRYQGCAETYRDVTPHYKGCSSWLTQFSDTLWIAPFLDSVAIDTLTVDTLPQPPPDTSGGIEMALKRAHISIPDLQGNYVRDATPPSAADIGTSDTATLALWWRNYESSTFKDALSTRANTGSGVEIITAGTVANVPAVFLEDDSANSAGPFAADSAVAAGADWHHLVVVVDRPNDEVHLYIDGAAVTGNPFDISSLTDTISAAHLIMGNRNPTGGSPGPAHYAYAEMYKDAAEAAEVLAAYNSGVGTGISGLSSAVFVLDVAELSAPFQTYTDPQSNVWTLTGDAWTFVPTWNPADFPILATAEAFWFAGDGNGAYGPNSVNPWADLTGNNHHAQLGATAGAGDGDEPTFDTDHWEFDGGDFFQIPSSTELEPQDGDFTAVVFHRTTDTGGDNYLASKRQEGSEFPGWQLEGNTTQVEVTVDTGAETTGWSDVVSAGPTASGVDQFSVMRVDRNGADVVEALRVVGGTHYNSGSPTDMAAASGSATNSQPMWIGRRASVFVENTEIDAVVIFKGVAVTDANLEALWTELVTYFLITEADATSTTAVVPSSVVQGGTVSITVTARNPDGDALTVGGDNVAVSVSGANAATPTVTDNGDGTYSAEYTAANDGTDSVAITLNGVAISGSPKTVIVGNVGILHSAQGVGLGLNLGLGI